MSTASVFFGRLNRKNVGNPDMRKFVETVRTHLQSTGCAIDDDTVWQLLRRFQILTFNYDAPGSQSLELALERARNILDPTDATDATRASALWKVLTETAIRVAASGGDLDRSKLLDEIANVDSFQLLGSRRNRVPRETLAKASDLAAAHLRGSIADVTLARSAQIDAVREARDHGHYVEIRGGPGVGKSGLLSMLVDQVLAEGRAIVLTPDRTIPGGWLAIKSALQVEGGPEAFLSDLASDGGAVLFIDSLDFFDDPGKRATVTDLVRAAASVPAFQVIVTARTDFDKDEPNWLPSDVLMALGHAPPVVISYLLAKGINQVEPFLSELERLITEGPVPFCGILAMNLLEVSPTPAHLQFLLSSTLVWFERQPNNTRLWVDSGLGARVAKWMEAVLGMDAALRSALHPSRPQIDDVLARLVQVGIAEAHRIEALLATTSESTS